MKVTHYECPNCGSSLEVDSHALVKGVVHCEYCNTAFSVEREPLPGTTTRPDPRPAATPANEPVSSEDFQLLQLLMTALSIPDKLLRIGRIILIVIVLIAVAVIAVVFLPAILALIQGS